MRRLISILSALLVSAALLLTSAGTSGADNGNNLPLCSNYEICFWWDDQSQVEKQYWNNADHTGGFWHVSNGRYQELTSATYKVKDNARQITNKDSSCTVFVGDYHGGGSWTWASFANNHVRYHLGAVNNRNDYHQRCGV